MIPVRGGGKLDGCEIVDLVEIFTCLRGVHGIHPRRHPYPAVCYEDGVFMGCVIRQASDCNSHTSVAIAGFCAVLLRHEVPAAGERVL